MFFLTYISLISLIVYVVRFKTLKKHFLNNENRRILSKNF